VGFLLWILFDMLFSTILEVLFEITKTFDSDRDLSVVAVVWFAIIGFGGGLLTGMVAPDRLFDPGPFPGASLLALPLVLGTLMQIWGMLSSRRATDTSHLASWYGGATLGLGLASGRWTILAFIREVRGV
jgi:hypothetical protein